MRMHRARHVVVLILALAWPALGFAQFESVAVISTPEPLRHEDLFGTVRGAALAHADLTASDGIGGSWSNPGAHMRGDRAADAAFTRSDGLPFLRADVTPIAFGVSFVRRAARLAFGVRTFSYDVPYRTAFDPEGLDSSFHFERRDLSATVAVDVTEAMDRRGDVHWTVGAAWNHRRDIFGASADDEIRGAALDLGTTLGWDVPDAPFLRRVAAAALFRNVFDDELDADDLEPRPIPRSLQGGFTITAATPPRASGRVPIALTVAVAITHQMNDVGETDWHAGSEAIVFDHVVLRAGRHTVTYDSMTSWGAGLRLARSDDYDASIGWTRQEFENELYRTLFDTVGIRAAASF